MKEIVFVIDQTGSQSGWPIEKAKETMRYCIGQLNAGDTFQLLGFNTDVYPCFPAPVPSNPANRKQALDYLEKIEAEGGTDILRAVDYALRIPADPARLRMICYMTDGYVGDDMQILDYIRKHRGTTRMFPFGIGTSVNRFLIDGMAREGRGSAEVVTLREDAKEKAARFSQRVSKPLLLDVSVDWGGLPTTDVLPKNIPDVFSSGPIILKGRYTRAAEGNVTVRGLLRGKPWSQTVHVAFPAKAPENSAIPTLWAREKIEDLQSQDWLGAQRGMPRPEIKEQIVSLALDYRLMSQYTSFVAVEQRVVNMGGRSRMLDVPVEMPEGVSHEGIFGEGRRQAQFQDGRAKAKVLSEVEAPAAEPGAVPASVSGGAALAGRQQPLQGLVDLGSLHHRGRMYAQDADQSIAGETGASMGIAVDGGAAQAPAASAPSAAPGGMAAAPSATNGQMGMAMAQKSRNIPGSRNGSPYATGSAYAPLQTPPPVAAPSRPNPFAANKDLSRAIKAVPPPPNLVPMRRRRTRKAAAASAPADAGIEAATRQKIAPVLRVLLGRLGAAAGPARVTGRPAVPVVNDGRVEVQLWLDRLPPEGLKQLQALGFEVAATLRPGRLLIGTLPVERLEALAALPWVQRVEPPRYR